MAGKRETRQSQHSGIRLSPRVCEMLVALERHRNMGEAAAELGVLQSVLSRQLAGVEKSLGVGLFARTTRSIESTAEGVVLVDHAARILACLDSARDELAAIGRGSTGHIRLGVASVATAVLVPQAIAAFRKKYARVAFSIRDDTVDRLLNDLSMAKLDAAVLRLPANGHFQLEKIGLYGEPIRIVARGGHPMEGIPDLNWARLAEFEWILPSSGNAARGQLEMLLDKSGASFKAGILETLSVPLIIGLVGATDAISPLADSLARRCVRTEGFTILPIECPLVLEPVSFVWHKERSLTPALKNFMATLVDTANILSGAPAKTALGLAAAFPEQISNQRSSES